MTGYWVKDTKHTVRTHLSLAVQRRPMRIIGRSRGGARLACADDVGGVHLFCMVGSVWVWTRGIARGAKGLEGVCFAAGRMVYLWYGGGRVMSTRVDEQAAEVTTVVDAQEVATVVDAVLERRGVLPGPFQSGGY